MTISVWTVNEAANHLKITPAEVIKGLEAGDLPGMNVAGTWIVLKDPLIEKMRRLAKQFTPESKPHQFWDVISKANNMAGTLILVEKLKTGAQDIHDYITEGDILDFFE